ncbi:MucR family transcriptional regulator [Parasphingorhabdus sp.]|jgi:predicted transcriptional regulator|uniref:MucR family transcriptional regulator n=1 Tax=Parasphingorhabdus sp. TaxID=2709688 RepID=UPI003BB09AC8
MAETDNRMDETLISLTSQIVVAHVNNNNVAVSDLPVLINSVHSALADLTGGAGPAKTKQEPAVPIDQSIKPDHIVCLEDGKKFKMLKRHLMTRYNMTPEEYRAKWGLPPDYPMVSSNYSKVRSGLATKIGLGRK